uniref:Phytocyanin domain-containing protein n=1 Tax=Leersia perrieri TaxID=77586 RepID=A0A0D9W7T3_9ORYZ
MPKHTAKSRQMAALLPVALVAALLAAVAAPASAKDYTVGDSSGWTTGVDYTAWAKGKAFNIGDTLLFQYSGGHSVAEVGAADHVSCSASNPLRSYNDGTTTVTLTRPGTRYFICGATGHCAAGMKLAVTVSSSLSGGGGGGKPSRPGGEAPSDADEPAGTTTTRTSSTTSGAAGDSWARPATWLLFLAAAWLALLADDGR